MLDTTKLRAGIVTCAQSYACEMESVFCNAKLTNELMRLAADEIDGLRRGRDCFKDRLFESNRCTKCLGNTFEIVWSPIVKCIACGKHYIRFSLKEP